MIIKIFISLLRKNGSLNTNTEEKLEFGDSINQLSDDAQLILSKDIRQSITRVAPQALEQAEPEKIKNESSGKK